MMQKLKRGFKIARPYKHVCPKVDWKAWDWSYTMQLWVKSFEELKKYYSKSKNVHMIEAQRKEIVKSINKILAVSKRIATDDYTDGKAYNKYVKNHNKYRKITKISDGCTTWSWHFPNKKIEQDLRKEFRGLIKEEEQRRKADCKLLGELLYSDLPKIWD